MTRNKYDIPYYIWDNIGLEREEGYMDLSDLLLYSLDRLGINVKYFSNMYSIFNDTDEYNQVKELINYDISFGKNYLDLDNNEDNEIIFNFKEISIDSVDKISDKRYKITGSNFTEYIDLYINNKKVSCDIEYINENEIMIDVDKNIDGKKLSLGIRIGNRKNAIDYSNEIIINN